ncbi:hypothetical protein V6N13_035993 [Hibiscus sabdariffa]|uniref:Uncharacterized protein n=1 Tax=Hibiscus sabdariffa TaxID=183260 RepID=A0ABR2S806_9ROSI
MENDEKPSSSGLLVNLSELFSTTTNVICRITSARKYSEDTNKFKKLLTEFTELLGTSDVRDRLPWLAWVSHVNGFNAKAKEFDEFLDGVGEEHVNSQNQQINDHKEIQGADQKDCGCFAGDSEAKHIWLSHGEYEHQGSYLGKNQELHLITFPKTPISRKKKSHHICAIYICIT